MPSIRRALNYLMHDKSQFLDSCIKNIGFLLPDKLYLSLRYKIKMGTWINWKNPETFTEKIQWLKIYDYKQEYTHLVDKLEVKKIVADLIGDRYIIPTLHVWDNIEDIDWNALPDQFVLKTSHGGGGCGVIVCENKDTINKEKALSFLRSSMNGIVGKEFRERPYYNVPRKIFAEKFVTEGSLDNNQYNVLTDFKFYCFNGEPVYCQVIRDRNANEKIDFYDMQWNHMPFVGLNPMASFGLISVPKPDKLNIIISICRKLSKDLKFSRIDFYIINGEVYFGEITFYPAGGFGAFSPMEWNKKLGIMIDLNAQ